MIGSPLEPGCVGVGAVDGGAATGAVPATAASTSIELLASRIPGSGAAVVTPRSPC